jgi:hypothetical protein
MEFSSDDFPDCVKPPYETQFYWPSQDLVLVGNNKKAERQIYTRQDMNEYELYKVNKLEAFIRTKGLQGFSMPPTYDRSDLLRFLYGCGFVTKKSYNAFIKHLKWREAFLPPDYRLLIGRLRGLLSEGVFYIHGRDSRYRPLIVLNIAKVNLKQHSVDDYINLLCFILTYIMDVMLVPGQVENWVVISDLAHKGVFGLPTGAIKRILTVLLENFRCRLALNYILNAPSSMTFMWMIAKAVLDARTLAKCNVLGTSYSDRMLSHFAHHQIEQKYGGTAPNLTSFWPPYVPPPPFSAPGDEPHALLTNFKPYVEPAPLEEEVLSSEESVQDLKSDSLSSREPEAEQSEVFEAYAPKVVKVSEEKKSDVSEESEEVVEQSDESEEEVKAGTNVFKAEFAELTRGRPVQLLGVERTVVTQSQQTYSGCYHSRCSLF